MQGSRCLGRARGEPKGLGRSSYGNLVLLYELFRIFQPELPRQAPNLQSLALQSARRLLKPPPHPPMLRVPLEALSLLVGPAADLRVALPARALHERHRVPDALAPPNIACAGAVAASRHATPEERTTGPPPGAALPLPCPDEARETTRHTQKGIVAPC